MTSLVKRLRHLKDATASPVHEIRDWSTHNHVTIVIKQEFTRAHSCLSYINNSFKHVNDRV